MKGIIYKIKYDLAYKIGRRYGYCFDCLMKFKIKKTYLRHKRCYECSCRFVSGRNA